MKKRELHLEHRPKTFDEFLGNEKTVKKILDRFDSSIGFPHAVLLVGPKGSGKTTLARLIAGKLGCMESMFHELNTGDLRGVDTSREIIENSLRRPMVGPCKIFFIDEAHELTSIAQDALLKVLEDSPEYAYYILATTNPEKLLDTVIDRCTPFQVETLSEELMYKLIDWVLSKEKKEVSQDIKQALFVASEGTPRTALRILGSILDLKSEEEQHRAIADEMVGTAGVKKLCRALNGRNKWNSGAGGGEDLRGILKDMDLFHKNKNNVEALRRAIMTYFSKVLWDNKTSPAEAKRIEAIMSIFEDTYIYLGPAGLILGVYRASLI